MENLKKEAGKHGDKLAAISAERLMDVKADFDKLDIDTSPYYNFAPRADLGFMAQSVLVVAFPSPLASVSFHVGGEERTVMIPAAYADEEESGVAIEGYLSNYLEKEGFHLARADGLPCKPIAAHAGLGVYGRNNIIYVDGMGSFLGLHLFFSDIPCAYDSFYPLQRMDTCKNCCTCVENCPTCALTQGNDLVDATHCITSLNEHPGAFPSWLNPAWHNALVGCTKCQFACPQNQQFVGFRKELASFDEEQTQAFLQDELPEEMLKPLGLRHYKKVLSRNLKALLQL